MPLVALNCSTTTSASSAAVTAKPQAEQEARHRSRQHDVAEERRAADVRASRPARRSGRRWSAARCGCGCRPGTSTPSAIVTIFICSPMPNHRMSSGISASVGIERLICTGPSIRASPSRERPDDDGEHDAQRRPRGQPERGAVQRRSAMFSWSLPSSISRRRSRRRSTVRRACAGRGGRWRSRRTTADQQRRGRCSAAERDPAPGPRRRRRGRRRPVRASGAARTGARRCGAAASPPPYRVRGDVLEAGS